MVGTENLPSDILEDILSRLPFEVTLHAKHVCTTWRAILRNKTEKLGFLFAHYVDHHQNGSKLKQLFYEDEYDHDDHSKTLNYYSDNFIPEMEHNRFIAESVPKKVMVVSCNGLVCFGKYYEDCSLFPLYPPFLICNPFNGESVCLPEFNYSELPRDISSLYGRLASGFGYCPSTSKYKVVAIFYCKEERDGGYVHVYTLSGGWRNIGFTDRCAFNYSSGIYANGALFWLDQSSTRRVQESEIVAFDLEGEKFHYIALPRSKDLEYIDNYSFLTQVAWRE
ncbi:F-box protein At3g07870-like [Papaver somniferum]|uniref:F-box protein At3g07870-like n=1 Tax=Papaver somniferum TaxID=3469 RepID=UPI000E6F7430|nr:F-box protein At3g07870-like [Papaver somniferum]